MKLKAHAVEKPWGREDLPPAFPRSGDGKTGEIWFEPDNGADLPLLVKYIFTSERLSVQVHPDDDQARSRGVDSGKTECWYILSAEPGATLGLGVRGIEDPETLRSAALDGSIVDAMEWKPVVAGDFFYVPAGTIHAIGAGITLIEVQQNKGVTYRLYDYGRPRELHLDDAVSVARAEPYPQALERDGRQIGALVDGPHFTVIHANASAAAAVLSRRDRWVVPLAGELNGAGPGACLYLAAGEPLRPSLDADCLIAWSNGPEN